MRPEPLVLATLVVVPLAVLAAKPTTPQAVAQFHNAQGRMLGQVKLNETPNGVLIALDLEGLPPGEHALHIHAKGECKADKGFESAGDHYAPGANAHGYHVAKGPHAGDLPNIFVSRDGRVQAEILTHRVSVGPGKATLMDADQSALVIHAKPDDYRSQPSGDAGDRIACAVIAAVSDT